MIAALTRIFGVTTWRWPRTSEIAAAFIYLDMSAVSSIR